MRCWPRSATDWLQASPQRKQPESRKMQIVLDPGYGFGKRLSENYVLLNRQAELLTLGRPLLAGLSRKSFLGHTLAPLFGGSDAPLDDARTQASQR